MQKSKLLNAKNIISVVISLAAVYGVKAYLNRTPDMKTKFEYAAEAVNEQCPMLVDSETRLDNAMTSGKVFKYFYTLMNVESDKFDKQVFEQSIIGPLTNNIKTHPDLKIYRDEGMTLEYNYDDKEGIHLTRISVTPEMYKNL